MILLGLEIVIAVGVASGCSYLVVDVYRIQWDRQANRWLSVASEQNREQSLLLKSEFHGAEVKLADVDPNHTHGSSAAERSTASLLMRRVAEGVGRRPFYFQGSGADARSGKAYSRTYFWAKDLMAPYLDMTPEKRDIICMVDVDYYIEDLETMLVDLFQPYLLYTLVPSAAAKDGGDYNYRFLADGRCDYGVSGGGRYVHHIWNWDGDSLRVEKYLFGFPIAMARYGIERRQMGPDHQLVLLTPLVRTLNPFWVWACGERVQARRMCRFNPVVGNFVRFEASKPDGLYLVTGVTGEYASSCVPASIDSIIASTSRTITGKLGRATVLSKMDTELEGRKVDKFASEILLEFHLAKLDTKERVSIVNAVRRFQWVSRPAEYDEDAKVGMTAFMSPLLDGGFVPDICKSNEERMVDKRVKEVTAKELPVSKFMMDVMDEFLTFLIPEEQKHKLAPVDVEEVYVRQSRPSQRAILSEAEHTESTGETKQFIKREAYGYVNDPRGISTICGPDKLQYSRYMYAFTDEVMKPQVWYAFGKSPKEVADRVTEVACGAVVNGAMKDFSRMDGRHGNVLHHFERRMYGRAFSPEHHFHLFEVMDRHHHLRAKTTFGIRYMTEYHRLSGGADTSCGNTADTAFIAYLTYRMQGLGPADSWQKLGVYGGDDGFDTDVDSKVAARAAALVGQKLDLEIVKVGKPGVCFLARRFGPDVWYGDNNSCCDIKRQLAKFHLTVNLPSKVTAQQKLQEKSFSFALTDKNTPIIGEFVTKVLDIFPLKKQEFRNELGIWGVEMDADRQYPNTRAQWMDDIVTAELPDFDLARFRGWIEQATGGTILSPPQFAERLPADPKPGIVAVDDDIIVSGEPAAVEQPARPVEVPADGKPRYRARKPKAERDSRKLKPTPKQ
jgi:hypothetical protein